MPGFTAKFDNQVGQLVAARVLRPISSYRSSRLLARTLKPSEVTEIPIPAEYCTPKPTGTDPPEFQFFIGEERKESVLVAKMKPYARYPIRIRMDKDEVMTLWGVDVFLQEVCIGDNKPPPPLEDAQASASPLVLPTSSPSPTSTLVEELEPVSYSPTPSLGTLTASTSSPAQTSGELYKSEEIALKSSMDASTTNWKKKKRARRGWCPLMCSKIEIH